MEIIKQYRNKKGKMIKETLFSSWNTEEKRKPPKNINLIVNEIVCDNCGKFFSRTSKHLNRSISSLNKYEELKGKFLCEECSHKLIPGTKLVREHNSKAQLIAQNKQEQKIKNSEGVKRSRKNPEAYEKWYKAMLNYQTSDESRKKKSYEMKKRWENPVEREKMLNCGKFFTSCHGDFFSKFSGKIRYESSYELLFIFLCDLNKIKLSRFDIGIKFNFNNKECFYFPDFVSNGKIYEIKSHAILKKENKEELFKKKIEAINDFINSSQIYNSYEILFEEDLNKNGELDSREYIYSWLLKDGFIKNNYGGKSMLKKISYLKSNYNNKKFLKAKELYKRWISLK